MPFRIDNALIAAAGVVQRLADYRPAPQFHELWRGQVEALGFDDELKQALLDPDSDRRRTRRDAVGRDGDTPARVHAHDVLAERGGRRADEDERDP